MGRLVGGLQGKGFPLFVGLQDCVYGVTCGWGGLGACGVVVFFFAWVPGFGVGFRGPFGALWLVMALSSFFFFSFLGLFGLGLSCLLAEVSL